MKNINGSFAIFWLVEVKSSKSEHLKGRSFNSCEIFLGFDPKLDSSMSVVGKVWKPVKD